MSAYAIPGYVISSCRPEILWQKVLNETAYTLGKNEDRVRDNVIKRQAAIAVMYVFSDLSLSEIGKKFNRDHSTVIYSIKKVNDAFYINDTLLTEQVKGLFKICWKEYKMAMSVKSSLSPVRREVLEIISERVKSTDFVRRISKRK